MGGGKGCFGCRHAVWSILPSGRSCNFRECPCSLPWENSASLPWLVWHLGVAGLWLTSTLSLACFALLGAVGQGWLGREGSRVPWWPPAWLGHIVPRHCEGVGGGISPVAMTLIPEGDGWISGAPVRPSAPMRVVALLHLLSEHSRQQHPAAPAAVCVRVLVYKGFLSTSKVQLLHSRGMTKPES